VKPRAFWTASFHFPIKLSVLSTDGGKRVHGYI
jgi:hypothetical protein